MMALNNRLLFFVICMCPIFSFGELPEAVINPNALNEPCYIGSIKQEDLIICFSKAYLLAQKKLNNNYLIARKQKNANIKKYLIRQQIEWNKNKFKDCMLSSDSGEGREGVFEYLQCVTSAVLKQNEYLEQMYVCGNNPCRLEESYFFKLQRNLIDE